MMASIPTRTRYTPEEYLALEADTPIRHEFYRGEIFAMAGGSREHNQIARNLLAKLFIQLEGTDCTPYTSDTRVKVQATGLYTYPAVSVACKPFHFDAGKSETLLNPRVLVEVLSRSTIDQDFGFKLTHYRQLSSLEEILFFWQTEPRLDHFVRRGRNEWLLTTLTGLDGIVELTSIGCRVPMSQIYANVEFDPSGNSIDQPEASSS
jgi:Uma2 family endonuclease